MGFATGPIPEENAMKTLSRFVTKFTSLIVAVLSCFDRVIFKGHLPIANGPRTRILRRSRPQDPPLRLHEDLRRGTSDRLVDHAKRLAAGGRPHIPLSSPASSARTSGPMRPHPRPTAISEGLSASSARMETCPSFELVSGPDRPQSRQRDAGSNGSSTTTSSIPSSA